MQDNREVERVAPRSMMLFYMKTAVILHEALGTLVPAGIMTGLLSIVALALGFSVLPLHFLIVWLVMVLITQNVGE
jgi:hypothetical protein